jgi:hypothetical protein
MNSPTRLKSIEILSAFVKRNLITCSEGDDETRTNDVFRVDKATVSTTHPLFDMNIWV